MRSGRIIGLVLCAAALTGIGGCGGGGYDSGTPTGTGNNPPPPTSNNSVTVRSSNFSPATITVAKGTTVKWNWDTCSGGDVYGTGQTCVAHNVTFDGASASLTQETGSWSRTFPDAGTFNYQCTIHGAAMSGKVVVQ